MCLNLYFQNSSFVIIMRKFCSISHPLPENSEFTYYIAACPQKSALLFSSEWSVLGYLLLSGVFGLFSLTGTGWVIPKIVRDVLLGTRTTVLFRRRCRCVLYGHERNNRTFEDS